MAGPNFPGRKKDTGQRDLSHFLHGTSSDSVIPSILKSHESWHIMSQRFSKIVKTYSKPLDLFWNRSSTARLSGLRQTWHRRRRANDCLSDSPKMGIALVFLMRLPNSNVLFFLHLGPCFLSKCSFWMLVSTCFKTRCSNAHPCVLDIEQYHSSLVLSAVNDQTAEATARF